jgi:hypothetical protein
VDLPSRGLPNSFCWCWPPGPAVKMVNMFSCFSFGVGPHAFSIGRRGARSPHILFTPEDSRCRVDSEHDAEHIMHWTTYFLSLSIALVTLGGDNISIQCCNPRSTSLHISTRPRPESIRPLALTLGRQTESATPLEFTFPQKPTARTSHRPQHPFRTPHHHSQTPHHCPCPTTALKLCNYCQFQGTFNYTFQGQMDHLRRVLGWSTEKPTIVYWSYWHGVRQLIKFQWCRDAGSFTKGWFGHSTA